MEDADLFRSRRRDASRCPTRTRVVAVPETPNQRLPSKAHAPRSRRPPPQRGTAGETPWRDREWRNERSRPSWVKKPTAGESRKSSATCQLPPVNVSTFCLLKPPACPAIEPHCALAPSFFCFSGWGAPWKSGRACVLNLPHWPLSSQSRARLGVEPGQTPSRVREGVAWGLVERSADGSRAIALVVQVQLIRPKETQTRRRPS